MTYHKWTEGYNWKSPTGWPWVMGMDSWVHGLAGTNPYPYPWILIPTTHVGYPYPCLSLMLPACSHPWVNPHRYEYGSPEAYPLANLYLHSGYGFFGRLGTGMALDTCGLSMLLPTCTYCDVILHYHPHHLPPLPSLSPQAPVWALSWAKSSLSPHWQPSFEFSQARALESQAQAGAFKLSQAMHNTTSVVYMTRRSDLVYMHGVLDTFNITWFYFIKFVWFMECLLSVVELDFHTEIYSSVVALWTSVLLDTFL